MPMLFNKHFPDISSEAMTAALAITQQEAGQTVDKILQAVFPEKFGSKVYDTQWDATKCKRVEVEATLDYASLSQKSLYGQEYLVRNAGAKTHGQPVEQVVIAVKSAHPTSDKAALVQVAMNLGVF